MAIDTEDNPDEWFRRRAFAISAHRLEKELELGNDSVSTLSQEIYYPNSTAQIATIVKYTGDRPIACVCGGHETSNSATVASSDAIIVDVCRMKAISMQDDGKIVTVAAGVLMEELAVAVRDVGGALPLGAGHSIGVVGFVVNGGASACLSRRLGLLGQCVTGLTMVDAVGDIHHLTPEDGERFTSQLGAGSALGIITEISFKVADESIVQRAEQFVQ